MSATTNPAPPRAPQSRIRSILGSFGFQITAALVLGVLLGLVARQLGPGAEDAPNALAETLATIGSSYVALLKTAVEERAIRQYLRCEPLVPLFKVR